LRTTNAHKDRECCALGGAPAAHAPWLPCSAPPESSHLIDFVRPEVARAPIAPRLVWALLVVSADPRTQLAPGGLEAHEAGLPAAFLLQAAEEALDDRVLRGCVRGAGDENRSAKGLDD